MQNTRKRKEGNNRNIEGKWHELENRGGKEIIRGERRKRIGLK